MDTRTAHERSLPPPGDRRPPDGPRSPGPRNPDPPGHVDLKGDLLWLYRAALSRLESPSLPDTAFAPIARLILAISVALAPTTAPLGMDSALAAVLAASGPEPPENALTLVRRLIVACQNDIPDLEPALYERNWPS